MKELFVKDIYVANVHFKLVLEPYKCQIAKYFLGLCPEPHWDPSEQVPKPGYFWHRPGLFVILFLFLFLLVAVHPCMDLNFKKTLFKLQWHIGKHSLELDLGTRLISISLESNVIEIHHVR